MPETVPSGLNHTYRIFRSIEPHRLPQIAWHSAIERRLQPASMVVMGTIYVRDVPDDVTAELKERAAAEGKSLSAYLVGELARMAARPSNAQLVEALRRRDRTQGPSYSDIVAEVGAGRR